MCIKISKPLNPYAQEWKPLHHHRIPPPPPPPFYHPIIHYFPREWHHTVNYYTPSSFPATLRRNEAAPPLCDSTLKGDDQKQDKKGFERKSLRKGWLNRKVGKPRVIDGGDGIAVGGGASSPRISRTTVMIRNIPNQLRRNFMLKFLDDYCREYSMEYDFFYLPMDFKKGDNLGYAFVNFTSEENALKCQQLLQGYKWGDVKTDKGLYTSKKICMISWAKFQGKERLVERFEKTDFPCDNMSFLPVVFEPPRGDPSSITNPSIVGRLKSN